MQNKNWYEYSSQFIAGCVAGAAFFAYKIIRGAVIGTACYQGVFAGLAVFGALVTISNAFNEKQQQSSQALEKYISENEQKSVSAAQPSAAYNASGDSRKKEPLSAKAERKAKGRSIVRVPNHYTVVDTETTGLDSQKDRVIEIAAIRVRGGKEVARFETLVKPGRKLSKKITEITGITDEELKDAPTPQDALQRFVDFLMDDIIVAHNANFDVNFIYDSLERYELPPLKNNYVDTLRLAKYVLPDIDNYKLASLAKYYKIPQPVAHRALADCETTMHLLQKLGEDIEKQSIDLTQYQKKGYSSQSRVAGIKAEPGHENPESPLYGKRCVFTGELDSMTRREAAQLVVNIGGKCTDKISGRTDYLIIGRDEYHTGGNAGMGGKILQAKELIQNGSEIQIVTESVFLEMLGR